MTIADFLGKIGINAADNLEPSSANEPSASPDDIAKPDDTAKPDDVAKPDDNSSSSIEQKPDTNVEVEKLLKEIKELKQVNQSLLSRTPMAKEKSISEDILNIAGFEIINEKE